MFKTFKVLQSSDGSWSGSQVYRNEKYLNQLDAEINAYCANHRVQVAKIWYSSVNTTAQHGSSENSTTRSVSFVAGVLFEPKS